MAGRVTSSDSVGYWVADKLGKGYFAERSTCLGLEKDGNIVAGVIYENWCGKSVVCHMVIEGRLTRSYLWSIFDYAFNVCGVDKVILPISSGNLKSGHFAESLGFSKECEISNAVPDGDLLFYTMIRSDCRFLGSPYGQERT
jgi:hypothetical protein